MCVCVCVRVRAPSKRWGQVIMTYGRLCVFCVAILLLEARGCQTRHGALFNQDEWPACACTDHTLRSVGVD